MVTTNIHCPKSVSTDVTINSDLVLTNPWGLDGVRGWLIKVNRKFSNCSIQQKRISRDKLEKCWDIKPNNVIKVVVYYNSNIPGLTEIVL